MKYCFLIMFFIFQQAVASTEFEIPREFHGRWANTQAQCDAEFPVFVVEISPKKIEGWETLSRVIEGRITEGRVTLSLVMNFEDRQVNIEEVLELSKDGNSLMTTNKDGKFKNIRCK